MLKPRTIAKAGTPDTSTLDQTIALNDQDATLVEEAIEVEATQTALVEGIDAQYGGALLAQIDEKHEQAGRIEDKLENLIETQSSRLQQTLSQQPGLLAMPGARQRWQQQVQSQQSSLQRLQGRLETVREIKEGMGVHAPRIEELASRKLRLLDPDLAAEWEDLQEAQRKHQALLRQQEQQKNREERQNRQSGNGQTLSLGSPR